MKATHIMAMVALAVASGLMPHVARAQPGITRTDLQRHDLSVPGREVVQVRVDIAPGVAFGNHTHPGEEIVYVIEGLLEYQVEGKPPVTLKAGEVLFIPAGTIHAARNVASGNGAELATRTSSRKASRSSLWSGDRYGAVTRYLSLIDTIVQYGYSPFS